MADEQRRTNSHWYRCGCNNGIYIYQRHIRSDQSCGIDVLRRTRASLLLRLGEKLNRD